MLIKGFFVNIDRCKPNEWVGKRLQLHQWRDEYIVTNGFGSVGVLDSTTKKTLDLFLPHSRYLQTIASGRHNGEGYDIEIKLFPK